MAVLKNSNMAFLALGVLLLATLASSVAGRMLLQRPPQCSLESGSWDDDDINCDFQCPSGAWELDCQATGDAATLTADCKVDRDGAPISEDVAFTCTVGGRGEVPDCSEGIAALIAGVNDTCVIDTVKQVLGTWQAFPKK